MDLPNHDSQSASSTQKNMESSLYELRILNGLHQGARTNALPQMLIGSDHECDIILRDQDVAPQLATLHVESTGWKVSANGIQIPHAELSFGQAIRLGSIIVSVASQQAPWPTEDKLQDIIVAQALPAELDTSPVEDEQKTDALSEDHETKSEGNSETDSEDSTTSAELSESSRKVWQAYLDTAQQKLDQILVQVRPHTKLLGITAFVLIAITIFYWIAIQPSSPSSSQESSKKVNAPQLSKKSAREMATAQLNALQKRDDYVALQKILRQMTLDRSVWIRLRPNNSLLLEGWVKDDVMYDRLVQAVAKVKPKPLLRVFTEYDLTSYLRDLLQEYGNAYTLQYRGNGQYIITGLTLPPDQHQQMLKTLKHEASFVNLTDNTQTGSVFSNTFVSALAEKGFNNIEFNWQQDHLEMNGTIEDTNRSLWERSLAEVNQQYNGALPFIAKIRINKTKPTVVTLAKIPFAPAPFAIRGIVGGTNPYLILPNEQKLMIGGSYQGYALEAVDNEKIVLNGSQKIYVQR